MKFNFKIQQYQTDAVNAVVRIFNGQGHYDRVCYIRDLGKPKQRQPLQLQIVTGEYDAVYDPEDDTGYKNEALELTDDYKPIC